jgi:hypothetical protein
MVVETRVADVEHIHYELITFLIASRDTVSARFWVVPKLCEMTTELFCR